MSSMWSKYLILKAAIKVYKNVDIENYSKLTGLLKSRSKPFKTKKAARLERMQIENIFV